MQSKLALATRSFALLTLASCGALPTSGIANAQQTAQQFNLDARFGRNEYVLDQVAPESRDEYAQHHRAWGTTIRVADVELGTLHPKGNKDVELLVHVAWYRPEQQELQSTTLKQSWHTKGVDSWQLVSESRVDGDYGLLGEAVIFAPSTAAPQAPVQFPIIRLGESASE